MAFVASSYIHDTVDATLDGPRPVPLFDHLGHRVTGELNGACQAAISHHLTLQTEGLPRLPMPNSTAGPPPKPVNGELSIAYLIMGHRSFAHATISRLVRVLWHELHLFMIHLDLKAPEAVVADLHARYESVKNVLLMQDRHAVGWGAFSMVKIFLRAFTIALDSAPSFDFFINLSDVDVKHSQPSS